MLEIKNVKTEERFNHIHLRGMVKVGDKWSRVSVSTGRKADKRNKSYINKNKDMEFLKLVSYKLNEPIQKEEDIYFKDFGEEAIITHCHGLDKLASKKYLGVYNSRVLPYFQNYKLTDITPYMVKKWQSYLLKEGLKGKTISNYRVVLNIIFESAKHDRIIQINPVRDIKCPKKETPKVNPMNQGELTKVFNVINKDIEELEEKYKKSNSPKIFKALNGYKQFKAMLIVGVTQSLRITELLGLKWIDIDFNKQELHIRRTIVQGIYKEGTKTISGNRIIPLFLNTIESLKSQYKQTKESEWVFVSQHGKPYPDTSSIYRNWWKPILKKANIDYKKLREIRHTGLSNLLDQAHELNVSLKDISAFAGHKEDSVTIKKYLRPVSDLGKLKNNEFLTMAS